MKAKPSLFHSLTLFDKASSQIIGCISSALQGNGSVCIKASKSGLSIAVGGTCLAKGKTPQEMADNFTAALAQAQVSQHEQSGCRDRTSTAS